MLAERAAELGYPVRPATVEALGRTWQGWEMPRLDAVFLSDDGLRVWLEAREREATGRKRAGGVQLELFERAA
jgi:hypothetical protein